MVAFEIKDKVFNYIFGNPKDKRHALSLYNTLNESSYTDPDAFEVASICDILYIRMKGDSSFLVGSYINFQGEQPPDFPNLGLRYLLRIKDIYEKYEMVLSDNKLKSILSEKIILPQLICFYNGVPEMEDRLMLSFPDDSNKSSAGGRDRSGSATGDREPRSFLRVKVLMQNIHPGHNKKLLDSCRPLQQYSWLIDEIRRMYLDCSDMAQTVTNVLRRVDLPCDFYPFLVLNRAELYDMMLMEYFEEVRLTDTYNMGLHDGEVDGKKEDKVQVVRNLISLMNPERISSVLKISSSVTENIINLISQHSDWDDKKIAGEVEWDPE